MNSDASKAFSQRDELVIASTIRACAEVCFRTEVYNEKYTFYYVDHPHGVIAYDDEAKAKEGHYQQIVERAKELIGDGKLHGWFQSSPSGEPIDR